MKWLLLISVQFVICNSYCQDIPELNDELESLAETSTDEIDDSQLQSLYHLHQHPLNLNYASEDELFQLPFVSPLLVKNLKVYQAILGKLVHINELQAVPGWTPELIRRLLPFITVEETDFNFQQFGKRFKNLRSSFLFRIEQNLKTDEQNASSANAYQGSPQHVLMKLQFSSGNLIQFGAQVEKDAGEPWLVHGGFDFNSLYFFARDLGFIKKIIIGDFQVNMGQGLLQWQGLPHKKSGNVLFIYQQNQLVTPYHSAGEVKFHRGVAIVIGKKHFEWMTYVSRRSLTANLKSDSLQGIIVTSISNSGYHRTSGEIEDRNSLHQNSIGSTLSYSTSQTHVNINWAGFQFSHPIQKQDDPYNLFSLQGRRLNNLSLDYSNTMGNIHWFGEVAIDKQLHKAIVNGMILSLDRNLDCSILVRSISRDYSSMYANAFTENAVVNNETGWYAALSFHPSSITRIDAYVDVYNFPWLKYRLDAPSGGRDFLVQFNWQPNKRLQLYTRWKTEHKEQDDADMLSPMHEVSAFKKMQFRAQLSWEASRKFSLNERLETSSFSQALNTSQGFLLYNECRFHPKRSPFDWWGRIIFVQTDSYDSRIYTFERDVQYGFSVPAYSGKGMHYALDIHYDCKELLRQKLSIKKHVDIWFNWSQTILTNRSGVGANNQATYRLQIIVSS